MVKTKMKEYIDGFNNALDKEITHEREEGGKSYRITEGSLLQEFYDNWIYFFHLDIELSLPDDTPIRIEFNNKQVYGYIISIDGFDIIVSLDEHTGEYVDKADMYCEPWKLLEGLKERLNATEERNHQLAMKVLDPPSSKSISSKNGNNEQEQAIQMALEQDVTFIWGPPGTGKTHTLAEIAKKFYAREMRVLILSHSNVAVDGAIQRVSQLLKGYKTGEILRYGLAKDSTVRDNEEILSFHLAARLTPELEQERKPLEKERKKLKASRTGNKHSKQNNKRLVDIETRLKEIRAEIRLKESALVSDARILATTLSKSAVDRAVYERLFDVVILDEASMAYIPQSFYAASLARRGVVIIGDFRQLAPIALADNAGVERWLQRDIFDEAGIIKAVEESGSHPNLVMLKEQRRMHPGISGFVDVFVYDGKLRDAASMLAERKGMADLAPGAGNAVTFIDVTGMPSVCHREGKSRFNPFSAFLSLTIAGHVLGASNYSVALITPYAAQARLLRTMIYDFYPEMVNINGESRLFASTVHRFQGSERDVVIFDCVDAYRMTRPGVLLSSNKHDMSRRLLNVAVTRARGKLIVIGHRGFLKSKLSRTNILNYLITYIQEKGKVIKFGDLAEGVAGKAFLEIASAVEKKEKDLQLFKEQTIAFDEWLRDLKNAKQEIQIDIAAENDMKSAWLEHLQSIARTGITTMIRTDNRNKLPSELKKYATTYSWVWMPFTVIDRKIIWYGVPWPEQVDEKWTAVRLSGAKSSQLLMSLLDMHFKKEEIKRGSHVIENYHNFKAFVENKKECPVCKKPLTVKISKKGKPFIACTGYPECEEKDYVSKDLLNGFLSTAGIACSECGSRMVARIGKFGIFAGCSNYPNCTAIKNIRDLM